MNPNRTSPIPLRAFGQRSISHFCSSNSAKELKGSVTGKGSRESFSDFLDRKLQRTSPSPKSVEEKSRQFSSPVVPIPKEAGCSENGQTVEVREERENFPVLGRDSFKLLKQNSSENPHPVGSDNVSEEEEGTPVVHEELNSRKRKDPFKVDADWEQRRRKPYLVLGGDTESERDDRKAKGVRIEYHSRNKDSKPHYNHYANGCGWWDGDMEGVDGEEVGHSEVWEGVGSSTFGEIVDWH